MKCLLGAVHYNERVVMKTMEEGSNPFLTKLGNWTALPIQLIVPLFTLSLMYKIKQWVVQEDYVNRLIPVWKVGHIGLGNVDNVSLFYNCGFYFRFMLPFWVGFSIRWSGKDPTKKEVFQMGLGWALNGRLKALCRSQSDTRSAEGIQGPNLGQATGWDYGPR